MESVIFEADRSRRTHDPATNFNLYGSVERGVWMNYATAPTAEALEKSKSHHHEPGMTWLIRHGLMPAASPSFP